MKKQNLTLEDHDSIGRYLQDLNEEMVSMSVKLEKAYPKNSSICRLAVGVLKKLTLLRCELDDAYTRENPDGEDLYYGRRKNLEQK